MLLMYLRGVSDDRGVGRSRKNLLVEEGLKDDDLIPRLDEGHEGTQHPCQTESIICLIIAR